MMNGYRVSEPDHTHAHSHFEWPFLYQNTIGGAKWWSCYRKMFANILPSQLD